MNSDMSSKLALISEVMADGYHYLRIRCLVEAWQVEASKGSWDAARMMEAIDLVHRLCVIIKG